MIEDLFSKFGVKKVEKVFIPVRKNGRPIDKRMTLTVGSPLYNRILKECDGKLPEFIEE